MGLEATFKSCGRRGGGGGGRGGEEGAGGGLGDVARTEKEENRLVAPYSFRKN